MAHSPKDNEVASQPTQSAAHQGSSRTRRDSDSDSASAPPVLQGSQHSSSRPPQSTPSSSHLTARSTSTGGLEGISLHEAGIYREGVPAARSTSTAGLEGISLHGTGIYKEGLGQIGATSPPASGKGDRDATQEVLDAVTARLQGDETRELLDAVRQRLEKDGKKGE